MTCPVCANAATAPAMSGTDYLLETTSANFRLSRCGACGSLFLDPPPTEAEIATFYPPQYWWHSSKTVLKRLEDVYRRLVSRDHVAFIERAARNVSAEPSRVRILDVGCGPGTLLGMLRRTGYQVMGLDFSREAAAIAKSENGVDVQVGTLREAQFPDGAFGLVTLFHVVEHVPDPHFTLQEARRILQPDGRLVLQVPNVESWQSRLMGESWWGLHVPRHIVNYSARSIVQLLERSGFQVRRVRHFNLRDNAAALASSLCPGLDPQVRSMRQQRRQTREALPATWLRHAAYLALVTAAIPFALAEAAAGAGATVMIEASRA